MGFLFDNSIHFDAMSWLFSVVVIENCSGSRGNLNKAPSTESVFQVKYPLHSEGHFYQHDDVPDENSIVPRALQWISIADVLHAPVREVSPIVTSKVVPH